MIPWAAERGAAVRGAAVLAQLTILGVAFLPDTDPVSTSIPPFHRIVLGVGLSLAALPLLATRRRIRPCPTDLCVLGTGLAVAGLALLSEYPTRGAVAVERLALVMAAYGIGRSGILTPDRLGVLTIGTVLGLLPVAGIQMIQGRWLRSDAQGGPGAEAFELVSSLGNPDYFAAWILLVLPMLVGAFRRAPPGARSRPGGFLALTALALAATYSRTAWIAAALTGAIAWWSWGPAGLGPRSARRFPGGLGLGFFAVTLLAGLVLLRGGTGIEKLSSLRTLEKRVSLYSVSLGLVARSPMCGTGPGSFGAVYPGGRKGQRADAPAELITDFAHNIFLQGLVEGGLLLTLLMGLTLFSLTRSAADPADPVPADPVPAQPRREIALGLVAFFLHNQASVSAFVPVLALLAALMAGILVAGQADAFLDPPPRTRRNRRRGIRYPRPPSDPGPPPDTFPLPVLAGGVLVLLLGATASTIAQRGRAPRDPAIRYVLAGRLVQAGETGRARALYLMLEAEEPDYSRLHYNRGRIVLDRGHVPAAQRQLESHLRIEPDCFRTLYALAECRFLAGDRPGSRRYLDRCLASAPPAEVARRVNQLLASIGPSGNRASMSM